MRRGFPLISQCVYKRPRSWLSMLFFCILTACASQVPVQEMSNARQSIQVAKEANAELLAKAYLARAQALLDEASRELDRGDFEQARTLAVQAQQMAMRARNEALSQHK